MHRSHVVICTAKSEAQAGDIVSALKAEGFPLDSVSVLLPSRTGTTQIAHEAHTKAPEGASIGAGTGGLAGGIFGLLVGLGTLTIPGLGPFVAAGPILSTLSGIAAGGTLGGVTGWLVGLGLPEVEARLYQRRLQEGGILVAVDCGENDTLVSRARDLFDAHNAEDVSVMRASEPARKTA